jgi:4-hydroxy-tetrahydrodipicolinate reductase
MGRAVAAAAAARAEIVAEVDRDDDLAAALDGCDAYIDFSTPAATRTVAIAATVRRRPAVIGTTGLAHADNEAIAALAQVAPIVLAANFSLGVNLVLGLAKQAARVLGPDWDAEVVETHHHAKGDVGPRPPGEIGVSAVRGGDVVGEHVAYFFGAGERVELAHRATSRAIFAQGALRAAAWVVGKAPGRYDMLDVLGFGS